MPIYETAHYQVNAEAVEKVTAAIETFVRYVSENEPGARMYSAWQQEDDATKFVHLFIFVDESAQEVHSNSQAVKEFEAAYGPELVDGPVVFTRYRLVASNT